jgi:sugar phosphate isomerase/epimerase
MKFAVSSYSFSPLISNGTLNQLTCIAKAKEMGFDAIEFVDILPHDSSSPDEYATKLREEAQHQQIVISCYTVGADFLNGCDGNMQAEIARVKEQVDLAEILGVSRMRHDATFGDNIDSPSYRSFDTVLPILADACRQITVYAAKKGIRTMVENHGFFCQGAKRVEKLVNLVAHPNFGLLMDIGNFLCVDENPALSCAIVAPYTIYAHAKDFYIKNGAEPSPGDGFFRSRGGNYLRGAILGHGNVPVQQCLYALKRVGYDDTISIEFEGMEDHLQGIAIGLSNLKRYWELDI